MAKKNQNPGADEMAKATAPGAESEQTASVDLENNGDGNTDVAEESPVGESGKEQETGDVSHEPGNLNAHGLTIDDVKFGVEHTDLRNGKCMFWCEKMPDGGKLLAKIDGNETVLEFAGGLAIYAKGGGFKFYPSIQIN